MPRRTEPLVGRENLVSGRADRVQQRQLDRHGDMMTDQRDDKDRSPGPLRSDEQDSVVPREVSGAWECATHLSPAALSVRFPFNGAKFRLYTV